MTIALRIPSTIGTLWQESGRGVFRAGAGLAMAMTLAAPGWAEEKIIRAHGISIFGDLKYPADFTHFDYVNPQAPKGGSFSTWGFGTFDSLTPYILKGNAASLSSSFYDSLMTTPLDEPEAMYGLVAHSVEYPESREWAIFHLRPEAKFADGTPVTAEDVVFSFEALRDKGRPAYGVLFKDFKTVEALDSHRVKYTFAKDGALREMIFTAAGLPIFSKAYYANRDFAESSLEPPLGSGGYALKSVRPGQSVTYERRKDYWAADLPVNKGTNNFDEISIEYFADYTAAFEAFKGGAYTFREEYSSRVWATSYDFPALKEGYVKRERLADGRPAGTQGWWFNMRREKFSDPRVREAIAMMFNFEWSNESLFYGLYERTNSFWENSATMQADGLPTPGELAYLEPLREKLDPAVFTEPAFEPPVSKADNLDDRRLRRKAGKLLDAAGWTVASDGLRRNSAGEVLSLRLIDDSPSSDRIVLPFVENLKRLGIEASYERLDAAQLSELEKQLDYDMVPRRYAMSNVPGVELRALFGSEAAETPGSLNLAGLSDPVVDALIAQVENAPTREKLDYAVKALDRVLRTHHLWVPNWYNPYHNIAYYDVFERPYTDTPPRSALGEMSIWWYSPEKAQKLKDAGVLR